MDMRELLTGFTKSRRDLSALMILLKGIARLDERRSENLVPLRRKLQRVLQIARERGEEHGTTFRNLVSWAEQYEKDLSIAQQEMRVGFGAGLQQELRKQGLSLSGQYPELSAGCLTLGLNFDVGKVTIWYGPKQERLGTCGLNPPEVALRIEEIRTELGSHLPVPEFFSRLRDAHGRVLRVMDSGQAPIIQVLAEMAFLLQDPKFRNNPRREHYKGYGRVDFSYDLFCMHDPLVEKGVRLVVASRSYAAQPQDFLWIPDSESVSGTVYSHLFFKE